MESVEADSGLDDIGELAEDEGEEHGDGTTTTGTAHEHGFPTMQRADPSPSLSLSMPLPADPRYPGENIPDPFFEGLSAQTLNIRITALTTPTPTFLLYLLVSWLHTACQLAFPACRAVLVVVGQILAAAGILSEHHALYISLASVMAGIGVEPVFCILPVCPSCLEVYPAEYPRNLPCRRCSSPIFSHTRRHDRRRPGAPAIVQPLLQFPVKGIEAQLREILVVPGMEGLMDGWRTKSRAPGSYQDNFDGRVCQELRGPDGRTFFENPLPPQSSEVQIGLTLGVDWFVPTCFATATLRPY